MKIVQITDLHCGHPYEYPNDIDVRKNFQTICNKISSLDADLIVITGDLCLSKGDESIYRWIKSKLDEIRVPYHVLPGNHDSLKEMQFVFGPIQFPLVINTGNWQHLYIDSSSGKITKQELKAIEDSISMSSNRVVWMHHPPLHMGVPHMDRKYALKNGAELIDLLTHDGTRAHFFCGHYHVDKQFLGEKFTITTTPSLYFQIDWTKKKLAVDHHRIGFNYIELHDNFITNGVKYFQGYFKPGIPSSR